MKESTHPVMKIKTVKKEGVKPIKKFVGNLSKKTNLQGTKDDRVGKGVEEHKTSAKQARLKVKIEETIQYELWSDLEQGLVLRKPRKRQPLK